MALARIQPPVIHALGYFLGSRPKISRSRCISCGRCAEGCPPKAIKFIKGHVPVIYYRHRIRCYFCQELCPQGAVEVAYPWIRRVMGGGEKIE